MTTPDDDRRRAATDTHGDRRRAATDTHGDRRRAATDTHGDRRRAATDTHGDRRRVAPTTVRDLALARSGDKGDRATLSVVAFDAADLPRLQRLLTAERVAAVYGGRARGGVDRHVLPSLGALHFVLHGALAGGVTRSLALDAHGKTLSSLVLAVSLVADPPPDDADPGVNGDATTAAPP